MIFPVSAILIPVVKALEGITDPFIKKPFKERYIKNICVVLLQGIGNAVLFTPALIALKKEFPSAQITILAKKENIEILSGFKGIEFLEYPTKTSLMKKIGFILSQRKREFDVVVYGCPNVYIGSSLL